MPNISLGTVYRNLNQLVDSGQVKKIKMKYGKDRFDRSDQKHNHFVCNSCHKIIDLYDDILIEKDYKNFKVMDYEIKITGLCEDCLRKEEKNGQRN